MGMALIVIPIYKNVENEYRQELLMAELSRAFGSLDSISIASPLSQELSASMEAEQREEERWQRIISNYRTDGILHIPRIKVKLPIIHDATTHNLDISVASLKGTGPPGTDGNYAIAGHRSRIYGQLLNRADELEIGDVIDIETTSSIIRYIISEKLLVNPEDVWVLENKGKSELTIVTCHPIKNPTHRLIIKGVVHDIN